MKIVKIPTVWTPEQADSMYRFIQSIQASIWYTYQDELQSQYRRMSGQSVERKPDAEEPNDDGEIFDDDMPF